MGLHACIARATNDLLLITDPDVFWLSPVDSLYKSLMEKHDLNIVGVSHYAAVNRCFWYFPYVINCMVRKSTLPSPDWMAGEIKDQYALTVKMAQGPNPGVVRDGKYLLYGPIAGKTHLFPNQTEDSVYDTGCNLWLWNLERGGRWLSFQTTDNHTYTTMYHKSNFKFKNDLGKRKLIYHAVGATNKTTDLEEFERAYRATK